MPAHRTPPCIELSLEQWKLMEDWSRRALPREACGLLLGLQDARSQRVLEVSLGKNLSPAGDNARFDLDPVHLVEMEDRARAKGWEILGLWHSHPRGAAIPSDADLEHALVEWSYPILALDSDAGSSLRSWRLRGTGFQEQRVSC